MNLSFRFTSLEGSVEGEGKANEMDCAIRARATELTEIPFVNPSIVLSRVLQWADIVLLRSNI